MRKTTKLAILLAVLAALCLTVFLLSRRQARQEAVRESGETILAIDPESVTSLAWTNESGSFAFRREGDGWVYEGDEAFPVDGEKLTALLEPLEELGAAFTIEDARDLGQYGLSDPAGSVTVGTESGTYTLTLGDYSQLDAQRYLSLGDGKVYLVTHDPMEEFDAVLRDLILDDSIPAVAQAEEITFSGAADYTAVYDEDGVSVCGSDVYFSDGRPLDTDRVTNYLDTLSGLTLTDYVTYNATVEELLAYGLETPELSVTVRYAGEDGDESFTVHLGRDQAAEETGDYEAVTAYLRVGDSRIVYEIPQEDYENLAAASYDDLRHQKLFTASLSQVTELTVTQGSLVSGGGQTWPRSALESTTRPFLARSAAQMISMSSSVTSPPPSTTAITSSARSMASRLRCTPSRSTASSLSRMPAVSHRRSVREPRRSFSSMVSRVVPGMSVTIARS